MLFGRAFERALGAFFRRGLRLRREGGGALTIPPPDYAAASTSTAEVASSTFDASFSDSDPCSGADSSDAIRVKPLVGFGACGKFSSCEAGASPSASSSARLERRWGGE